MKATHIIGKYLNPIQGGTIKKCCMCGAENLQGLPRKQVLSSSFMDWEYIQDGDGVCVYCAACFGIGQKRSEYLRFTNFLATPSRLLRFKRDEIWKHLFKLPGGEPFVFGVTYTYKKHITFKATVNQPKARPVLIQTENNRVLFTPEKIEDLIPILQKIHGSSKYIGKVPSSENGQPIFLRELLTLRQKLKDVIRSEEYEKAARIRDRISELEKLAVEPRMNAAEGLPDPGDVPGDVPEDKE